ncbi:MAG: dTDP-4-dehydrorhamnose 3,5-epimerase [Rickettsiales bacterium]|nr:dTDP-4-dehydrorhamnose 3,5-epimerase [Pseudomonadota bacterium]MDA0966805.1 dTDP-4-dehydrorhamnose 3,5-epimerase [Pseudomonadota bacterium]MDG4543477.1 dTDP-4-dehydrorhamnose 3,5-epimerase [Rickettsiales bacterium]MDG4546129.1 dTDP-4-dehydrorhamnose 3,5-epimerase [Rickettsiales bacterium]MDG4547602.1 dTDP-4-dehydrorhamnose 3,5-epimerase [Rickettsiales bacterium]
MKIQTTPIKDLLVVELDVHGDERGFFVERFHFEKFSELGLPTIFPQDNHSRSAPNVLRGVHYQHTPAQGKLVGVIRGRIWDVAVDIRPESETFGQYFGIELDDINGKLLWIPAGFAHGFCVLSDDVADVYYKVTSAYNPQGESGIAWNDPELSIDWPLKNPIISTRDTKQQSFKQYKNNLPDRN